MNELLKKIKSRGHWRVLMRPQKYIVERVATLAECETLIEKNQVQHRGWYFPHTDRSKTRNGLNYIELPTDMRGKHEVWRFYQSGQFVFWGALDEDWLEEDPFHDSSTPPKFNSGEILSVLSTLYRLSEIYEFASRLAQSGLFDDRLFLSITLFGTKDREMRFWVPDRSMGINCLCDEPSLPREKTFQTVDFIPKARELALKHFLWIAERFQCGVPEHVFRRDQEKFFEGRY